MADYVLRDVDDELWKKVKVRAAMNEESIRDALLRLLKQYANGK